MTAIKEREEHTKDRMSRSPRISVNGVRLIAKATVDLAM